MKHLITLTRLDFSLPCKFLLRWCIYLHVFLSNNDSFEYRDFHRIFTCLRTILKLSKVFLLSWLWQFSDRRDVSEDGITLYFLPSYHTTVSLTPWQAKHTFIYDTRRRDREITTETREKEKNWWRIVVTITREYRYLGTSRVHNHLKSDIQYYEWERESITCSVLGDKLCVIISLQSTIRTKP